MANNDSKAEMQKASDDEALSDLRQQIDSLDRQLIQLLNNRAKLAQAVAEVKEQNLKPGETLQFYRPEREAQVLRRVMELNPGPLAGETVARIFREVMSACLALEEPTKVAYLGPQGTFTQAAALKHLGRGIVSVALPSINDVFREVSSDAVRYGVVPVENSTQGMVSLTLDSFQSFDLKVCGEVELRIHHHLLIGENTKPEAITRIYSHQQSFAQCRNWLDTHMPQADRIELRSNGEAAKRIQNEWNAAAIAGDMSIELYNLTAVANNIEDNPNNTTRFLIIGKQDVGPSGKDKTSIIVTTENKPGALNRLLDPFETAGISLTRIETRPAKTSKWHYVFFIDFEGHVEDANVREVMREIEKEATAVRWLGSYPKAVI